MATLNLGIVAHVDAGKTTLTERLLFETGVISTIGRVDHGDTTTDSDALERQRGITIRSGVVAFHIGDLKVNLIDTPGHSDFVAEVERALSVLDGAVLAVSAVEGVQAQTRVLIRIMEQLQIPFLVFVNKIDRVGAQREQTLAALDGALRGDVVPMNLPGQLGSRSATVRTPSWPLLAKQLTEQLAEYDETALASFVEGTTLPEKDALARLRRLVRSGHLHPTFFGAALHGLGVGELMTGIEQLLPPATGSVEHPLHAQVFKIDKPVGSRPKVTYVRVRSGVLTPRDHVTYFRRGPGGVIDEHAGRASAVRVFDAGASSSHCQAPAGEIATVIGLSDIQIGDQLGAWDPARGGRLFAEPGLEAVVRPVDPARHTELFQALRALSEQDPLIAARLDGLDEELTVSLYGEVQKEVLASRLLDEFGIAVEFAATRTIHVERVSGTGESVATASSQNATVGLRVAPGAVDSGLTYRLEVERGWLLPMHHTAIEEALAHELGRGVHGWRIADCAVTLIAGRFCAPTPPPANFRELTSRTFREALLAAGTVVCEPVSDFELEFPSAVVRLMMRELAAVGATPDQTALGPERGRITGTIPTASVHAVEERLPRLTRGLGVLITEPAGHRPIRSTPERDSRPR